LHTYLKCPLKFYLTYVLETGEPPEATEEIDHGAFGALAHLTLQLLYTDLIDKHPGRYWKELAAGGALEQRLEEAVDQAFRQHFLLSDSAPAFAGQQRLAFELVKKYARTVIEYDTAQADLPCLIKEIEQNWCTTFKVTDHLTVRIGGKVDRFEYFDNHPTILDYKTGKVKAASPEKTAKSKTWEGRIGWLFDHNAASSRDAAPLFQAYLYVWLSQRCKDNTQQARFDFFSTRVSGKRRRVELDLTDSNTLSFYEQQLKLLVTEIFDPEVPFFQTTQITTCADCAYKVLCQR
jgi:RecB family exonuclease